MKSMACSICGDRVAALDPGIQPSSEHRNTRMRRYSSTQDKDVFTHFLAILRYLHIHRWKDVEHAPIKHLPIKHAADLPVCGVANFAFVDHRPRLGCRQSLAACAASFEVRCRISYSPAW